MRSFLTGPDIIWPEAAKRGVFFEIAFCSRPEIIRIHPGLASANSLCDYGTHDKRSCANLQFGTSRPVDTGFQRQELGESLIHDRNFPHQFFEELIL
jgi:hypothetical protein